MFSFIDQITRFIAPVLIGVCFMTPASGDEVPKEEKDPDIIFDSEGESALFATVTGSWKLYEFEGEQMIRLTPEPIQECRVEMGAILSSYDVSVTAKVLAKEKGRLKPRMGVGIFGPYGFTLRLAPARNMIELVQYGEVIAESPLAWESAQWHYIKLRMEANRTNWRLSGKVWPSGQSEPEKSQLEHIAFPTSLTHPLYGRAYLTGSPFNGLPIFYDEVVVRKYPPK